MAGGGFPIPRDELPVVRVTKEDHAVCRDFVERMLGRAVVTFETFVDKNQRVVDERRWKHMASRDGITIHSKRKHPAVPVDQYGSVVNFKRTLPPVDLLMTGESPGTVDNTMHAVITASQTELALVVIYLHEDVADCAMLNTMEPPTEDEPYHFLGYKMFVRKSPTSSSIIRHRDSTYLEACGLVTLSNGEQVGYHIMHSVDLADFPPLVDRNCVRSNQSVTYLYRQKYDNVVEVFMIGSLDINGYTGIIKPIANVFIADTLFGIARLIDCSEAKRLTDMVRRCQSDVDLSISKTGLDECKLCHQKRKMFSTSSSIAECVTCGKAACARCRSTKRIFISDGILGRFEKVECCRTCVVLANRGFHRSLVASACSGHSSTYSAHSGTYLKAPAEKDRETDATAASSEYMMDNHLSNSRSSVATTCSYQESQGDARSPAGSKWRSHSGQQCANGASDLISLDTRAHYQQLDHSVLHVGLSALTTYAKQRRPMKEVMPLDGSSVSLPPPPPPPHTGQQSSDLTRLDVYKQLVELQQIAESTYRVTKHTGASMTK